MSDYLDKAHVHPAQKITMNAINHEMHPVETETLHRQMLATQGVDMPKDPCLAANQFFPKSGIAVSHEST